MLNHLTPGTPLNQSCHGLFVNTIWMYRNLMVPADSAKLKENLHPIQTHHELHDVWNWMQIRYQAEVRMKVVTAGLPLTIDFHCHVQQGRSFTARSDDAKFLQVSKFLPCHTWLFRCQMVRARQNWYTTGWYSVTDSM